MNAKSLICVFLLSYACLSSTFQHINLDTAYVGKSNKWIDYPSGSKGIYMNVNMEKLNLCKTPIVKTWLTCISTCWTTTGSTSQYLLTDKGFRVYVYQQHGNLNPSIASYYKYELHYEIIPVA